MCTISFKPRALVHVVTWNNAATVSKCIISVLAQENINELLVEVTDNASTDCTVQILERDFSKQITLYKNSQNFGFSNPHNAAALRALAQGIPFTFFLNPDAFLTTGSLSELIQTLERDLSAGCATPLLLRASRDGQSLKPEIVDAAGMYITPTLRHFDRGSGQPNSGFDTPAHVFGGTGAALLIRYECLADLLSMGRELFDEDFFAYREDADLAWRCQWLGWNTIYQPRATVFHIRHVVPEKRKLLSNDINRFGVRNRFLLQFKNLSFWLALKCLPGLLIRNPLVILTALTGERSSARGLVEAVSLMPRILSKRRELFAKKRRSSFSICAWFSFRIKELPLPRFNSPNPQNKSLNGPEERQHDKPSSLTIVIVNYNSGERLGRLLELLLASLPANLTERRDITLVVVDNNSSDQSRATAIDLCNSATKPQAQRIAQSLHVSQSLHIYCEEVNHGFSGAINFVLGRHPADDILVLNPDIEITYPQIEMLQRILKMDSNLAALAPLLKNLEGIVTADFCAKRLPTLGSTVVELLLIDHILPNNLWSNQLRMKDSPLLESFMSGTALSCGAVFDVQQPPAACIMIRSVALMSIGGFDERYWPAWFEDVDACKRFADAGWRIGITNSVVVTHQGGYSKEVLGDETFDRYWYTNLRRYWDKHGRPLERATIRLCLLFGLTLRALYAATKLSSLRRSRGLLQLAINLFIRSRQK